MVETLDFSKYTVKIDSEIPLPNAFEDTDPDTQAWAVLLFTNLVEDLTEPPILRYIDKFFDTIVLEGTDGLRCIALSRMREGRHAWLVPYLVQQFRDLRPEKTSRIVRLVGQLCQSNSVDPYHLVPHLIGLLHDDSGVIRQGALDSVAQIESSGVDPLSEFVRSSYEWHIRSIYLERERWMSIFGISGTVMYGVAVAFAASLVLQLRAGQTLTTVTVSHLSVLILIFLMSALSICYATRAENELEKCLRISNRFLEKRKEMRKKVQGYFIRFLENRHKKWRSILATLLRFYLSMTIPLLVSLVLGLLPVGILENPLYMLTLIVLVLSLVFYVQMREIEIALVEKQKTLREYYGR